MSELINKLCKVCIRYYKEHPDAIRYIESIDKDVSVITINGDDSKGQTYVISGIIIRNNKITAIKDLEGGYLQMYLMDKGFELPK